MRFSSFVAVLLGAFAAAPAKAECFVCDDVIELTEEYASCFESGFDELMAALDASNLDRQMVNLAGCSVGGEQSATRGGLLEMGVLPEVQSGSLKSVYILDRASAICLRDAIDNYDAPFDPSTVFRLAEVCTDG